MRGSGLGVRRAGCDCCADLWIVIADPHRPGHEVSYWPGDVNFRCADAIVINKANTAPPVRCTDRPTDGLTGWKVAGRREGQ
jgi:hypothetical protein